MSEASTTVRITPQVRAFVRSLAPETRHKLRLGLRELERGRGDLKALEGSLQGYHRLRIGAFRIIVRFGTLSGGRPAAFCIFAEHRSLVYVMLQELLENGLGNERAK
jgi:mRNA-degrading endonuclease RelE of RelBE toxin-antitoxin system